jgi:hypothetical protein
MSGLDRLLVLTNRELVARRLVAFLFDGVRIRKLVYAGIAIRWACWKYECVVKLDEWLSSEKLLSGCLARSAKLRIHDSLATLAL